MKKIFFLAALVLTAAFTLTSCGGDDEPKVKTTVTSNYYMTFSQDLLDACNMYIIYKAENGRNVYEPITSTVWSKAITSDKFPAEFGVMCTFSTKSETELTKEKYNLTCDLNFSSKTSKGASYSNNVSILNETGVSKNKVISTLSKYSGKKVGYKVTEGGIYSEANNLNYDL